MIYADNAATTRLDDEALNAMLPYLREQYREVEQLVARRAHNPKVVGSSPALATTF